MTATVAAYLGLGSNQDGPVSQLRRAVAALASAPNITVTTVSPFYRNPAVGPAQADFVNAVAAIRTTLPATDLLATTQALELTLGRVRTAQRWGPRVIDIDILLYGEQTCATSALSIPHPQLRERAFVLYPLWQIAPQLVLPGGQPLCELVDAQRWPQELVVVE